MKHHAHPDKIITATAAHPNNIVATNAHK